MLEFRQSSTSAGDSFVVGLERRGEVRRFLLMGFRLGFVCGLGSVERIGLLEVQGRRMRPVRAPAPESGQSQDYEGGSDEVGAGGHDYSAGVKSR